MTQSPSAQRRPMRIAGERRTGLLLTGDAIDEPPSPVGSGSGGDDAALAYAIMPVSPTADPSRDGWTSLGEAPLVVRSLRLAHLARGLGVSGRAGARLPSWSLVAPFGGRRSPAVREITSADPRITRLWERFSVDVGAAVERSARLVGERVFERPGARSHALIIEDGDRYAIRAMCVFTVSAPIAHVVELLHDRSVAGLRAASHLLGLAVREASAGGAEAVHGWSFPHSGTFPLFVRHAFLPRPSRQRLAVRALDPEVEDVVTTRERWYVSGLDLDLDLDRDGA